ncbi:MAG: diaminopimelate decarboxylase [Phycisphaerae bacterium]|nr:diaminopimelate decarboxylase [Phycisphaerae bacterium]
MDAFRFVNGILHCEGVPLPQAADRFGTPVYVYSAATLRDRYDAVASAFAELKPIICYSVKSCQNLHILRLLRERGASFDVVSGGELTRALEAGADASKIVFAGVGKTDAEIRQGIQAGIGWFNVESEQELENLIRITAEMDRPVRAALRINPDVDPKTHVYTTTGKQETKFGVDLVRARNVFDRYGRDARVKMSALHLHIGSPVNTVEPYVEAIEKTLALIRHLREDGFAVDTLDIGGGFGTDYETGEAPSPSEYAARIVPLLHGRGLTVILEPGRTISANAGVLLGRVLYTKQSGAKRYVITDVALTELVRPALYGARHFAWPVVPGDGFVPEARRCDLHLADTELVDVVGPVCESSDFLAKGRWLPPLKRGDLLAVFSAGAYGFVMSSQYNSRPRSPEVLIDGHSARLIRRRETYDDLVGPERVE